MTTSTNVATGSTAQPSVTLSRRRTRRNPDRGLAASLELRRSQIAGITNPFYVRSALREFGSDHFKLMRETFDARKLVVNIIGLSVSAVAILSVVLIEIAHTSAWTHPVTEFLIPVVVVSALTPFWLALVSFGLGEGVAHVFAESVGVRACGGFGSIPVRALVIRDPLSMKVERYIEAQRLTRREAEMFRMLQAEWDGSVDGLIAAVRSFAR